MRHVCSHFYTSVMICDMEIEKLSTDLPGVMHLTGSLMMGGAERMAVNLSNVLAERGVDVHLCTSRREGPLSEFVSTKVKRFSLGRCSAFDVKPLLRLAKYIRKNNIGIVHAHSYSCFVAVLAKLITGVKVVWHDHYGNSEMLGNRPSICLKILSFKFDAVVVVNEGLQKWAQTELYLYGRPLIFLRNFAQLPAADAGGSCQLPGARSERIICAARLHRQKDHPTLLRALGLLKERSPSPQLFLVGEDASDAYSDSLRELARELQIQDLVHFMGGRSDVAQLMWKCSIGVLSSESEGLPVALLEYGLATLAPVCTAVGACAEVIESEDHGLVVPPKDPEALARAIGSLLDDARFAQRIGARYNEHIKKNFSAASASASLISLYKQICLKEKNPI